MRFRLLKRRLTISAPSMAIRSSMPWPLKWALAAVVLGFCAAIALWAFEFGKDLTGIDQGEKEQLVALQIQVGKLRVELDKAQSIANVSGISIATEKATQEKLAQTVKQLESDNQKLRDDLGFFERLIPSTATDAPAIRGLQAEILTGNQIQTNLKANSMSPSVALSKVKLGQLAYQAVRWRLKSSNTENWMAYWSYLRKCKSNQSSLKSWTIAPAAR
jgi:hypothetical protein